MGTGSSGVFEHCGSTPNLAAASDAPTHTASAAYSVELQVKGRLFATNAIGAITDHIVELGFRYDVVDVRPSNKLNGQTIAMLKLFGGDVGAVTGVVSKLAVFAASLPVTGSPAVTTQHYHSRSVARSSRDAGNASFGVEDDSDGDGDAGSGITVKQISLVHPVPSGQPVLVTRFLQFTGHLWTSGFMQNVRGCDGDVVGHCCAVWAELTVASCGPLLALCR